MGTSLKLCTRSVKYSQNWSAAIFKIINVLIWVRIFFGSTRSRKRMNFSKELFFGKYKWNIGHFIGRIEINFKKVYFLIKIFLNKDNFQKKEIFSRERHFLEKRTILQKNDLLWINAFIGKSTKVWEKDKFLEKKVKIVRIKSKICFWKQFFPFLDYCTVIS